MKAPPDAQVQGFPDGPPPILGSWRHAYAAVIAYLLIVIVLLYAFSSYYQF